MVDVFKIYETYVEELYPEIVAMPAYDGRFKHIKTTYSEYIELPQTYDSYQFSKHQSLVAELYDLYQVEITSPEEMVLWAILHEIGHWLDYKDKPYNECVLLKSKEMYLWSIGVYTYREIPSERTADRFANEMYAELREKVLV
jgi:hypothetical protein